MRDFLKLLKVKDYLKNALILFPFFFSGLFLKFDGNYINIAVGLAAFCFGSSFVYIINDYMDRDNDRKHPKKCNRPIARGVYSGRFLVITEIILLTAALSLSYVSGGVQPLIWICIYILLNIGYSLKLKNIPILDVFLLALFYVLRIYYGASILGIQVSIYLYLTVTSVSLLMGINKRKVEKKLNENIRAVLAEYPDTFLSRLATTFLGVSIVFYSLWVISETNTSINSAVLHISIFLVMIILVLYEYYIEKTDNGNPIDLVFDKPALLISMSVYAVLMIIGFVL